jgi:hypothetical protein
MTEVFKPEKILSYCDESERHFLKMLKRASKLYPEYHLVFMILSQHIKHLIRLNRAYAEAEKGRLELALKVEATETASRYALSKVAPLSEEKKRLSAEVEELRRKLADAEEKTKKADKSAIQAHGAIGAILRSTNSLTIDEHLAKISTRD